MKRLLSFFIVVAMLMALFVVPSFATYESQAEMLNTLGLFRGTDSGYELDREPQRVEAAVMLVRLLGKEAEALEGTYDHPFTDVPEWADQYIGYMYTNDLTNGVSEDQFGSSDLCDGRMYATFVLRSLGYDDQMGDFTYNDALSFAKTVNILTDAIEAGFEDGFNRGDMVAISYLALNANLKGEENKTLLSKLVEENAVTEDNAKIYTDRIEALKAYEQAMAKTQQLDQYQANMNMTMKISDGTQVIDSTTNGSIKFALTGENKDNVEMQMVMNVTSEGESVESTVYMKDGYMYTDANGQKIKIALPLEEMLNMVAQNTANIAAMQEAVLKDIKVEQAGEETIVSVTMDMKQLNAMAQQLLSQILPAEAMQSVTIAYTDVECVMTVNAEGYVTKQDMTFGASIEAQGQTIQADYVAEIEYINPGEAVEITFPDFTDYQEINLQQPAA